MSSGKTFAKSATSISESSIIRFMSEETKTKTKSQTTLGFGEDSSISIPSKPLVEATRTIKSLLIPKIQSHCAVLLDATTAGFRMLAADDRTVVEATVLPMERPVSKKEMEGQMHLTEEMADYLKAGFPQDYPTAKDSVVADWGALSVAVLPVDLTTISVPGDKKGGCEVYTQYGMVYRIASPPDMHIRKTHRTAVPDEPVEVLGAVTGAMDYVGGTSEGVCLLQQYDGSVWAHAGDESFSCAAETDIPEMDSSAGWYPIKSLVPSKDFPTLAGWDGDDLVISWQTGWLNYTVKSEPCQPPENTPDGLAGLLKSPETFWFSSDAGVAAVVFKSLGRFSAYAPKGDDVYLPPPMMLTLSGVRGGNVSVKADGWHYNKSATVLDGCESNIDYEFDLPNNIASQLSSGIIWVSKFLNGDAEDEDDAHLKGTLEAYLNDSGYLHLILDADPFKVHWWIASDIEF